MLQNIGRECDFMNFFGVGEKRNVIVFEDKSAQILFSVDYRGLTGEMEAARNRFAEFCRLVSI